jgi:hypothetical protein
MGNRAVWSACSRFHINCDAIEGKSYSMTRWKRWWKQRTDPVFRLSVRLLSQLQDG